VGTHRFAALVDDLNNGRTSYGRQAVARQRKSPR